MNKIAILQSNYIPWRGYFDIINQVDIFVIYDEVQYTKNDWRNRNIIKTPNGPLWLTIPVKQFSLNQKILETQVDNQLWRKKHLNSIKLNYPKAKYYNEYIGFFENIYSGNEMFLSEINLKFITLICSLLNIKTKIINSQELNLQGDKNERLIDACKKLNANYYLSGISAKNYLKEEDFIQNNIEVQWMNYSGYKEYFQLYPPFYPKVSILDELFNVGNKNIF